MLLTLLPEVDLDDIPEYATARYSTVFFEVNKI
jgi:hypothetical protein